MKSYYSEDAVRRLGSSNIAEYVIDSAQPSDTGTYSCVAQNSAGPVEDRIQLIVSEDVNEVSGGENVGQESTNEEENKTTGPFRGDISGNYENAELIPKNEDLVNTVGSKAVLTCNAGTHCANRRDLSP